MKDHRGREHQPTSPFGATVVRQFAGSRIEKDLIVQVFEVLWKGGRDGAKAGLTASKVKSGLGASDRQSAVTSGLNLSEGSEP